MIQKVYEVTCDYCDCVIIHAYYSKRNSISEVKRVGGLIKGNYQFCNQQCYQQWIQNGRKSKYEQI